MPFRSPLEKAEEGNILQRDLTAQRTGDGGELVARLVEAPARVTAHGVGTNAPPHGGPSPATA